MLWHPLTGKWPFIRVFKNVKFWKIALSWKSARSIELEIFFNQIQTPVTRCSSELWSMESILVVRLAHSADPRSQMRHVSSASSVAYATGCSRVVIHFCTNLAGWCLTSVIWREAVCHRCLAMDYNEDKLQIHFLTKATLWVLLILDVECIL